MAVGAVILLVAISFLVYVRIASNRRMSALLAEDEKSDEDQESQSNDISVEDQKAMWGGGGNVPAPNTSQSFGGYRKRYVRSYFSRFRGRLDRP